jgi:hypothetical protein
MRAISFALLLASAAYPAILFTDNTLDPANYSTIVVSDTGQVTVVRQAMATGGNPGQHLQSSGSVPEGPDGEKAHRTALINPLFTYDPLALGPIGSIDFGISARLVSTTVPGNAITAPVRLAIRVNGSIYTVGGINLFTPESTWQQLGQTYLASDAWIDANSNPLDLAAVSTPIEFGFRIAHAYSACGAPTCGGRTDFSAFDNLSILVTPASELSQNGVPEPGTTFTLLGGLAFLLYQWRMQRQ